MYDHTRFRNLIDETVKQIETLAQLKGGEYAGDVDRLANFRRNANALGLSMEQVWAVYAGKHWDAIQQYVKDMASGTERVRLETIRGRADDLIVYLILFKAIEEERQEKQGSVVEKQLKDAEALTSAARGFHVSEKRPPPGELRFNPGEGSVK